MAGHMAKHSFRFVRRYSRLTANLRSARAEAGQTVAEYAVLLGIICTMVVGGAAELAPAIQERLAVFGEDGVLRGNGQTRPARTQADEARSGPRVTELVVADVQVVAHDSFTFEVTGTGEPWATRIELANPGGNQRRHEAHILSNTAGLPLEQVELRGRQPYLDGSAPLVQLGPLDPGDRELLTLTIPPGDYVLVCVVVDDGVTHFERGMVATFRVGTTP